MRPVNSGRTTRQDTTPELFVLNLWRASYGEEEDVSETYAGHQVMVKTLVAWWLMGRTYGGPMVEPLVDLWWSHCRTMVTMVDLQLSQGSKIRVDIVPAVPRLHV